MNGRHRSIPRLLKQIIEVSESSTGYKPNTKESLENNTALQKALDDVYIEYRFAVVFFLCGSVFLHECLNAYVYAYKYV